MHDRTAAAELLGVVHSKRLPGNHLDFCRFAHASGFQWAELKYEASLEQRESLTRDAATLGAFAHRNGMHLSVHAAYDDPVNVGSGDQDTRALTMSLYQESLDYAHLIGARFMTLHGGHIARSEYSSARYREVVSRTVEALRDLNEHARSVGISLCIENRHRFNRTKLRFPTYPKEMRACRMAVGEDLLFTIDSGHANGVRGHTLDDFVHNVGPASVGITHLHDNDGTADQHLVPGEGSIEFSGFLRSWLHEQWRFPLLLELNSLEDYQRGKARVEAWLDGVQRLSSARI